MVVDEMSEMEMDMYRVLLRIVAWLPTQNVEPQWAGEVEALMDRLHNPPEQKKDK